MRKSLFLYNLKLIEAIDMKTSNTSQRRILIIGATSGIGRALAMMYLKNNSNNIVGIAGRRIERLEEIHASYPDRVVFRSMDVCTKECTQIMDDLLNEMGGADLIIYCAGTGRRNEGPELHPETEMPTVYTNVVGFTQIIIRAYNYFRKQGGGHFVTIASVAGIRPLRFAPAYSATKRYKIHYTSTLAAMAHKNKENIHFTTIKPGFIKTELLHHKYPLTISLEKGSRLIYKAIEKKKRNVILPGRWRWIVGLWRLMPFWEKF